jgi:hypothetical protein
MIITGSTNNSRLNELKKFTISDDITKQYFGNGDWINNGVDFTQLEYSNELIPQLIKIVYFIDGIKYTDFIIEEYTVYEYDTVGTGSTDFINVPYYKDPKKENIVSQPKIDSDVFIVRQQLSAFENNYLLEHVDSLFELETFAGGNYFNIVNNT